MKNENSRATQNGKRTHYEPIFKASKPIFYSNLIFQTNFAWLMILLLNSSVVNIFNFPIFYLPIFCYDFSVNGTAIEVG